jgi:predicted transcriptional regulator of viral defense system
LHVSAGLRIVVPRLEVAAVKANRSTILRSRDRFWRPADIAGAPSTVQHLLADLAKSGELRRVRKGLYWRGTKTPLGMSPPPTDALATEVANGKGVGPAGLSAANLLRLSTQVPRRAQIAVPARAGRSTPTVEFVSRAARTGRRSAGQDRTEVAILEVLNDLSNSELSPQESWRELRGAVMS